MLHNFQLAAIVKRGALVRLLKIPMNQDLQRTLANNWQDQLSQFLDGTQEIEFNAGYEPEEHECFALRDFSPPGWLASETSLTTGDLDPIGQDEELLAAIKGIVGFARDESGDELALFQKFTRSHVVKPGRFLLLRRGTYETNDSPGLTLDTKLAAVFSPDEQKLRFRNFRAVNVFLPLGDFYAEASEQQIREILAHEKLAPVNAEALATDANQWFRKRFAMLRDSGVLDQYSTRQIRDRSKNYAVDVQIQGGRIVFPEDRPSAKKMLQFLNEELFRGAITATLYETNSKREAD